MAERLDEAAWESWLARIADPAQPLEVGICGYSTIGPEWEVAERVLPQHLFYLLCRGAIDARWSGGRRRLEPWCLFWLPAGTRCAFSRPPGAGTATLYHLRVTLRDQRLLSPSARGCWIADARELRPAFASVHEEHVLGRPLRAAGFRAALVRFLCQLFRRLCAGDRDGGLGEARQGRLMDLVATRLGRGLTPAEMARAVGLSPAHFARAFKTAYGVSPRSWLARERVNRAADALLESSRSVAEVAAAHGWSGPFLFSRQFRRMMGCSPSDWRRRQRPPVLR